MLTAYLLVASLPYAMGIITGAPGASSHAVGLDNTDCQLTCPKSTELGQVILPAITQIQHKTGDWENFLECWSVNTTTIDIPDVDNAFRLDWEKGFDAVHQYIFYGPSFMPSHPAPEPSLVIMSAGIGTFATFLFISSWPIFRYHAARPDWSPLIPAHIHHR
jgi:hypothetical protein